ncbi:hypothetical protein PHLCEN_2v9155 [Hermanssonia centrifuga]|uniref:FAM50A/XAP5 C-terminal domain-containing protein n=1 Tax=Hermanssonia centrifuga TaxID=98765 RepID=A0A2R6NRL9_9APHY|nr:hypothetical protein PHLCEN_2v9155 [Hermanssonia centrifuga]
MSTSQAEGRREDALAKQRNQMREEFERQKQTLINETEKSRPSSNRFVGQHDSMEDTLKKSTVGLVRLEEFQQRRKELEEAKAREAARTNELKDEQKKVKKRKKVAKSTLSFAMDDEAEEDSVDTPSSRGDDGDEDKPSKRAKSRKNPNVDTSFLPDREREEAERRQREELRQEWLRKQEDMKQEEIEITYSFWDGSGHRKSVTHYTFYDFIVNKARGKSGPLFNFDVHDDVRLLADATVEKDESHAGKVVERSYYQRNKHIFPASRWEVYDPERSYGQYTIA